MDSAALVCCLKQCFKEQITARADRDGCRVDTHRHSDLVVLDCDRFPRRPEGVRSADFLVIKAHTRVAHGLVIELKSGRVHNPDRVVEQLQAGADLLREVFERCPAEPVSFHAALFHGRGLSTVDQMVLQRCRVRFRGKPYPIFVGRCGDPLDSLL